MGTPKGAAQRSAACAQLYAVWPPSVARSVTQRHQPVSEAAPLLIASPPAQPPTPRAATGTAAVSQRNMAIIVTYSDRCATPRRASQRCYGAACSRRVRHFMLQLVHALRIRSMEASAAGSDRSTAPASALSRNSAAPGNSRQTPHRAFCGGEAVVPLPSRSSATG